MANKALIAIDIQNDYFPGGKWALDNIETASANAARLIEAARANGDMVVHVRHEFPSTEAPFFVPGSDGAEIHPSVAPQAGEAIVTKNEINSFKGTNLKSLLDENGIEDLVICGAMSHICVDAATRAASDFGYNVTLVHDACASRDTEFDGIKVEAAANHAAFMSALGFGYANTVTVEEYLGDS